MRMKENIRNRLPASTLVEVLILMILSGVVFLSVMDGLGLLSRFLDRTSQRIAERTEQYAGYFRTVDLAGDSDSLLGGVAGLRTVPEPVPGARVDTLIVELYSEQDSVLSIGFVSRRPPDPLLEKLSGLEAKYRYEENETD